MTKLLALTFQLLIITTSGPAIAGTGVQGIYRVSSSMTNEANGKILRIEEYGYVVYVPEDNTYFLQTAAHGACGKNPTIEINNSSVRPTAVYCDVSHDIAVLTLAPSPDLQAFANWNAENAMFPLDVRREAIQDIEPQDRIRISGSQWVPVPKDYQLPTLGVDQTRIQVESRYDIQIGYSAFKTIDGKLNARVSLNAGTSGLPLVDTDRFELKNRDIVYAYVIGLAQEYENFFSLSRFAGRVELNNAFLAAKKGLHHPPGETEFPVFKYYNGFYKDYGHGTSDLSPAFKSAGGERSDGGGERSDGGSGSPHSATSLQELYQQQELVPGVMWKGQRALAFVLPDGRVLYGERASIEYLLKNPELEKQVRIVQPQSDLTAFVHPAPPIKNGFTYLKSKSLNITADGQVEIRIQFLKFFSGTISFTLDRKGRWTERPNAKDSDEFLGIIKVPSSNGSNYWVDLRSFYFSRLSTYGSQDADERVPFNLKFLILRKENEKGMTLIEF